MKPIWLFVAVVVVAVVLASAVVAYGILQQQEAERYLPLKDGVVNYIATNHPDASGFLANLSLIYLGSGVFSGNGWYIEIGCASMNCTAYADFSIARIQNSSAIPHRILWNGTISNGTITEISYAHAV